MLEISELHTYECKFRFQNKAGSNVSIFLFLQFRHWSGLLLAPLWQERVAGDRKVVFLYIMGIFHSLNQTFSVSINKLERWVWLEIPFRLDDGPP